MALIVPKLWREKKLSKSVFGYFRANKETIENPMAIKLEEGGGGKGLMAWPVSKTS